MSGLVINSTKQLSELNAKPQVDSSSSTPPRLLIDGADLKLVKIDRNGESVWWPGIKFHSVQQMMKSLGKEETNAVIKLKKAKLFLEVNKKKKTKGAVEVIHLLALDSVVVVNEGDTIELLSYLDHAFDHEPMDGDELCQQAYDEACTLLEQALVAPLTFTQATVKPIESSSASVSESKNAVEERAEKPQSAKRGRKKKSKSQHGREEGAEKIPPAKRGRRKKETILQDSGLSQRTKNQSKSSAVAKRPSEVAEENILALPPKEIQIPTIAFNKTAPRTNIPAAIVSPQKESDSRPFEKKHLEWARAKFEFFPGWIYDQPGTGDVNCFHHCPDVMGMNLKKIQNDPNFKERKDYFLNIDDMKDFARLKYNWIDPHKRSSSRRTLSRKR